MTYRLDRCAGADISACGSYRYRLDRLGGVFGRETVNFVMLNPSTADAEQDDPTIRRCLGYAFRWGFARLVVTNLYALRSTDPRALWEHPDPVGPENTVRLVQAARESAKVVCAWGALGGRNGRGAAVADLLLEHVPFLYALRWTKAGEPAHPLYLPNLLTPKPWVRVD